MEIRRMLSINQKMAVNSGQHLAALLALGMMMWCHSALPANQRSGQTMEKLHDVKLTIIYDNNRFKKGLKTGWGFACLVEGLEETILFDTGGRGDILMENMKKLHIQPESVDAVFLSHIHQDHCGGLPAFLKQNHRRSGKTMKTIEIVDGRHPVTAGCPRRRQSGGKPPHSKTASAAMHGERFLECGALYAFSLPYISRPRPQCHCEAFRATGRRGNLAVALKKRRDCFAHLAMGSQ